MPKLVVRNPKPPSDAIRSVRLTSARMFCLSPPPLTCAESIAAWFKDPEIGQYLVAPLNTVRRAETAIRGADNRGNYLFGLFLAESSRLIGYTQVLASARHRVAKTTSVIGDKSCWGKGYAVEARAAILDYLFGHCAINKVNSFVYGRNLASIFNNQRLGYTCEGILRQQELGPDGAFRDVLCFGLLKDEWLARRGAERPKAR